MKMRFWILLLSAFACIASAPLMYLSDARKKFDLDNLVAECERSSPPPIGQVVSKSVVLSYVCQKRGVDTLPYSYNKTEIQQRIYYASNGGNWFNTWLSFSGSMAVFALIPFAWSFFLSRIRELSNAIRGK